MFRRTLIQAFLLPLRPLSVASFAFCKTVDSIAFSLFCSFPRRRNFPRLSSAQVPCSNFRFHICVYQPEDFFLPIPSGMELCVFLSLDST